MIATHQQGDEVGVHRVGRGDNQRLYRAFDRLVELDDQFLNRPGIRRLLEPQLCGRNGPPGGGGKGLGQFHVRCKVALGGKSDRVLAGIGQHVELV